MEEDKPKGHEKKEVWDQEYWDMIGEINAIGQTQIHNPGNIRQQGISSALIKPTPVEPQKISPTFRKKS